MRRLRAVAPELAGLPLVLGCASVTFSQILNLYSTTIQCERVCVNVL